MRAHLHELGGGETGQRPVARERDQPLETDRLLDPAALLRGALVVPQDRPAQDLVRGIERDQTVHLPRQPNPGWLASQLGQAAEDAMACGPPVLRILL